MAVAVADSGTSGSRPGLSFVGFLQSISGWIPDRVVATLLMTPTIVVLSAVFLLPLLVSLTISFFSSLGSNDLIPRSFVGSANYTDLISDPDFLATVWRTLLYTAIAVFLEVVIGFAMALILNANVPGISIVRTILILPMMMTPIVAALMWKLGFDYSHGFVNSVLPFNIIWLGDSTSAFAGVVGVNVWQNAPYVALILLAGLRTVPQEILDAAIVDGAHYLQRVWFVVIPILTPHLLLATLLRTIFEFRTFENVYVLTGGGPGTATVFLSLFTYMTSFVSYDLGLSAAAAWLTLILTLMLCGALLIIVRMGSARNAT